MNKLTVLILAAGFGRRMGSFSRMINKALIPYDNKPLISHIFDQFDSNTEFVIACGHMGYQIKDYLSLVHSGKNIRYIDVPTFDETSTGPATTLRHCAEHIDGPFIWISSDTICPFEYRNLLDHSWIVVQSVPSKYSSDYSWVRREENRLISIHNKQATDTDVDAFIGLMYVHDRKFIDNLNTLDAREITEGFSIEHNVRVYTTDSWKDFGTYEKWKYYNDQVKEVSFPKPDELFYDDNNTIVKFSTDENLTNKKFLRALLNRSAMPANIRKQRNFLSYDKESGITLYNSLTPAIIYSFLNWVTKTLWLHVNVENQAEILNDFYINKTKARLKLLRTKYPSWNEPSFVNGIPVKSIEDYLNSIDINKLCGSTSFAYIHGDMQPENIICNLADKKFIAIDWRSDFSGCEYGDIHYDIAKLVGGLYLNYEQVKKGYATYQEDEKGYANLSIPSVPNVEEYIEIIKHQSVIEGINWEKIRLLVPVIYLNMSPLHEAPFDKYLIALSQYFFEQVS